MRHDEIDAIDSRIRSQVKTVVYEGTIVAVYPREARVKIVGTTKTEPALYNGEKKLEPGQRCTMTRNTKNRYVILDVVGASGVLNATGKTKESFELSPPSNLTAYDDLPNVVLLTWNVPVQQSVAFEVQSNNTADETTPTTEAFTRAGLAIIPTADTRYYRVRSVSPEFEYSGWTDWVEGVPGEEGGGGGGGSLTGSTVFLASDVTLTNADTYYDVVSDSLAAGTYMISASVLYQYTSGTSQAEIKLWDGSTAYVGTQSVKAVTGDNPTAISIPTVVVTLGTTTTVKLSAASQGAGGAILSTPTNNATGLTDLTTYMTYVKIA